jgi:hypothetical protein
LPPQKKIALSASYRETALLTSGFFSLFFVVFFLKRPVFGDEIFYLNNVTLLKKYGFSSEFFLLLDGSAGPLHTFIHYIFEPFTRLEAPYVRFISMALLLGTLYFTAAGIRLINPEKKRYSFYILAIPMTYVIGGLALTEIPAIFFLSLSLFFVIKTYRFISESFSKKAWAFAAIAGICFGLAILGRQPYLIVIPAFVLLLFSKKNYAKTTLLLILFLFFSCLAPLYLFFTWKGLMPPADAEFYTDITGMGSSFRFEFFILCLFYFALSLLFIAPSFYFIPKKNNRWVWGSVCILIGILNMYLNLLSYTPLAFVINKMYPSGNSIQLLSNFLGTGIILLALYFFVNCILHLITNRHEKQLCFFIVALLLIAFSCTKITWGFSSRYAAQAIPLLVFTGSYFYKQSNWNYLRIIAGVAIGTTSLISYFLN